MSARPAIVLVQPRIPQNVGAVGRLCAVTRAELHVVRPIPFEMSDSNMRRAGMDYLELLHWEIHSDWQACKEHFAGRRFWFLTSWGRHSVFGTSFRADDVLVFGSESAGLPDSIRAEFEGNDLKLPMREPRARCLNLATSAAVTVYELLRQVGELGG